MFSCFPALGRFLLFVRFQSGCLAGRIKESTHPEPQILTSYSCGGAHFEHFEHFPRRAGRRGLNVVTSIGPAHHFIFECVLQLHGSRVAYLQLEILIKSLVRSLVGSLKLTPLSLTLGANLKIGRAGERAGEA